MATRTSPSAAAALSEKTRAPSAGVSAKRRPVARDAVPESATSDAAAVAAAEAASNVRVIKKYPNRRLYDTTASAYVTLADVQGLVMKAIPFTVRDVKTGEDLTRSILLQIILEEEVGGTPIFSEAVLANIIRFYGHAMQGFFGANLEKTIDMYARLQSQLVEMNPAFSGTGTDAWRQMMQAPMQGWQQMQEQMQHQYANQIQRWMDAFNPKR